MSNRDSACEKHAEPGCASCFQQGYPPRRVLFLRDHRAMYAVGDGDTRERLEREFELLPPGHRCLCRPCLAGRLCLVRCWLLVEHLDNYAIAREYGHRRELAHSPVPNVELLDLARAGRGSLAAVTRRMNGGIRDDA